MNGWQTAALGAVAGGTIFLGLPLGRISSMPPRGRAFIAAVSEGFLLLLFGDVVSAASDVLDTATRAAADGGSARPLAADVAMLAAGLTAGALGLGWIER